MKRLNKWQIGLAISLLLFSVFGYFLLKPTAPAFRPFLSFSPAIDGTKGLTMYLKEKHQSVKEWRQSWRFLPQKEDQLLLLIEPYSLEGMEVETIKEWVALGNDLIVFHSSPVLWEEAQFETEEQQKWSSIIEGEKLEPTKIKHSENKDLTVLAPRSRRLQLSEDRTPLLVDERGALAFSRSIGEGTMYFFLVPEWLTNQHILTDSHFEVIWPFFQKEWSVIWIDEYHHGYQSKPGLLAVYPDWLIFSCVQLMLGILVWLWWKGKRFGRILVLREWNVRRGDETLLATANWYGVKKLTKDALLHQERYLYYLLHQKWGIQASSSMDQILTMAERKWEKQQVDELHHVLRMLEERKQSVSYATKPFLQDSVSISKVIQRLEKE